nr:FdtA/QdtA family cupin domain-containing protein [Portibacter lacus]
MEMHGKEEEGYLSIFENQKVLPLIKRVFWTYHTPKDVTRGKHAHLETEMILIAVAGSIDINTIDALGKKNEFQLSTPNQGLYIPKMCWHEMKYSIGAVQLVLSSTIYDEKDYIRSFSTFSDLIKI